MVSGAFAVSKNQRFALDVRLEQLKNLAAEGWWSGELHVHRPPSDIQLLTGKGVCRREVG
jgi:hypothetical protein